MQKGFIQIPILIMILIGTAVVGGGGYYVVKEVSKTEPVEFEMGQAEIVANEDVATSTATIAEDSTEKEKVEETSEPQTQTVTESDANSPNNSVEINTDTSVATEIPQTNLAKNYPLDVKTAAVCDEIEDTSKVDSLVRSIATLCDRAENEMFEDESDFSEIVEDIHDKWDDWESFKKMREIEEAQEQQADNNNSTEDEESTTATAEELSEKYATIVKLTDSDGNVNPQSEHNEQNPTWLQPWPTLEVGDTVTFTVDVANQTANPVSYQFVGTGFPNEWQSSNSVTVNIDEDVFNVETIHLRVFVKNSDSQYRAPNYDDMIQVFYTKE